MFAIDFSSIEIISAFVSANWINLTAAVIALIWLYLEYKVSIWLWPVGIILPLFYIYISYEDHFYGNVLINIYYLLASIWGGFLWLKNRNAETGENETPITPISRKNNLISWLIALPLFGLIYYLTAYYTSSVLPWADALTTTISFIGMVWLAKKWQEHWLCWIVADVMSSFVFYQSKDYVSAIVFFIYFLVAVVGYFHWRSLAKKEHNETLS